MGWNRRTPSTQTSSSPISGNGSRVFTSEGPHGIAVQAGGLALPRSSRCARRHCLKAGLSGVGVQQSQGDPVHAVVDSGRARTPYPAGYPLGELDQDNRHRRAGTPGARSPYSPTPISSWPHRDSFPCTAVGLSACCSCRPCRCLVRVWKCSTTRPLLSQNGKVIVGPSRCCPPTPCACSFGPAVGVCANTPSV